jgi:hypothetical protein
MGLPTSYHTQNNLKLDKVFEERSLTNFIFVLNFHIVVTKEKMQCNCSWWILILLLQYPESNEILLKSQYEMLKLSI